MSTDDPVSYRNPGVYERIEARLDRIEDKLDTRLSALDLKVDLIKSEQDSLRGELRGSIGMLKWLGPTGVAALLIGLLRSAGLL